MDAFDRAMSQLRERLNPEYPPQDWEAFKAEAEAQLRESFKDVVGKREYAWLGRLEQSQNPASA